MTIARVVKLPPVMRGVELRDGISDTMRGSARMEEIRGRGRSVWMRMLMEEEVNILMF